MSRAGGVGEGRSGWLVDGSEHIESSNLAGVLGGLTLSIVEVGRHRDDGLGHGLTQSLGGPLYLLKNEGRELLGAVALITNWNDDVIAVALDRKGHPGDVLGGFSAERPMKRFIEWTVSRGYIKSAACDFAYEPLAVLAKAHNRG